MAPVTPRWTDHIQPLTGYHKKTGVVEALERLARALGPGARLPRMRELAEALGITLATLDQGLTQLERRGLLDRRPRSGVFVSGRIAKKAVGMVIGWNIFAAGDDAAFYALLMEHCVKLAEARGKRFSVFLDYQAQESADGKMPAAHQDLVDALDDGRLDGLLLVSPHGPAQTQWLAEQGVPLVALTLPDASGIVIDSAAMVRMAIGELMRMGVRKIGVIAATEKHARQFREEMTALGRSVEEAWVAIRGLLPYRTPFELEGRACAERLLQRAEERQEPGLPGGLIVMDDLMARGACALLAEKGHRIGETIQVVSHSNRGSRVLAAWADKVIRCEFDPALIAEAMFNRLEARMDQCPPQAAAVFVPQLISPPDGGK